MGSLVNKIEAVADKYANYFSMVLAKSSSQKLSERKVDDLRTETNHLMEEIGHALRPRPQRDLSFKARSPMGEFSLWMEFVESVKGSLERDYAAYNFFNDGPNERYEVCSTLLKQLTAHADFVTCVHESISDADPVIIHSDNCIIEEFFIHAAAVVIRTAHVCCVDRFPSLRERYNVDLHSEIVEFSLKFLKALKQIRASLTVDRLEYLVDSFVKHVLGKELMDKLDKELKSLVIFLVDKTEETINQDFESYLAEIRETIKEVVALNQRWRSAGLLDSIILAKIWLLKEKIWLLTAEIFIMEQLSNSKVSMFSMEDHIQALIEGMKNLRAISQKLQKERIENVDRSFDNGKQTLALIEEVASNITSLSQSSRANEIKYYRVRNSLLVLLSRIALFKAKSALMDFSNTNKTSVAQRKDQIQTLLEGMEFLISFVTDEQMENLGDVEMIFTQIKSVGRRIFSLYYSLLLDKEIVEQIIQNRSSELLDEVEAIKAKVRDICPRIPSSNFPKSDWMGFLDFLIGNALELLKLDSNSIAPTETSHSRNSIISDGFEISAH